MRIWVTGAGGQLGRELIRLLSGKHEVLGTDRAALDVASLEQVLGMARGWKPETIVNAAAYTNVDQAEESQELAYKVNALGPRNLAVAAEELGARIVHVSTDFVFDGTKRTPYQETDQANPLSVYGHSKLVGEQWVMSLCRRHYILRAAWLYGSGDNFVHKVLAAARRDGKLRMVCDQSGSPTSTLELARFIEALLGTEAYGLYHAASRGGCSRYEWTRTILRVAGMEDVQVMPVRSDEFKLPAVRPAYSVLDDWMIRLNGLPRMADWQTALEHYMKGEIKL